VILEFRFDQPSAEEFKALYDTTDWGPKERENTFYRDALQSSWRLCSAYSSEALIGFGRVISDGKLHAFITEMIVKPEFQGNGIGKKILDSLVSQCLEAGIQDIQLFCAEGKEPFYTACGFTPRLPIKPGMQYVGMPTA
jgi:GNAT superfamily N-acetyltransferase